MSKQKPTLGYWNMRGLGQPIRFLLKYVGEEFNEESYSCGPPPEYSKASWFDRKSTLDIPFVNLPYYIDGDIKITQSNAILRYIGRKHNLLGETEQERVLVDIMENQSMDFRNANVRLCYSPKLLYTCNSYNVLEYLRFDDGLYGTLCDVIIATSSYTLWADYGVIRGQMMDGYSGKEKMLPAFLKQLPADLKRFEDFLGDKPWFAGNKITVVDFPMYELLIHHLALVPDCLDPCSKLRAFIVRFEALPAIKKYMSSSEFIVEPIHGPPASACTNGWKST